MTESKNLTEAQKNLCIEAKKWCDENDKSTEFMLQYISDIADIEYEIVIEFLVKEYGT